jgi:hypothetical protein
MTNPSHTHPDLQATGELHDRLFKIVSQDGWVDTFEVDVDSQVTVLEALIAQLVQTVIGTDEVTMVGPVLNKTAWDRNDLRSEQRATATALGIKIGEKDARD